MSTLFGPSPNLLLVSKKRGRDGQMVSRDEHPLRCGYPHKLYSKFDRVSPIIDSMTRMYENMELVSTQPPPPPFFEFASGGVLVCRDCK